MSTTTTRAPGEVLDQALQDLAHANHRVAECGRAQSTAQKRVEEVGGLEEAARVELENAKAKHRVLTEADRLAREEQRTEHLKRTARETTLEVARKEFQDADKAQAMQKAAADVLEVADTWKTRAEGFREAADALERLRAEGATAARLRNELEGLAPRHRQLQEQHQQLEGALGRLRSAVAGFAAATPSAEKVAELDQKVKELEGQAPGGEKSKGKKPIVDQDDLEEAGEDLRAAEAASELAPALVRRAEMELQFANDSLAGAKELQRAAEQGRDAAENAFILAMVVSEPDDKGIVTARARLQPGMEIPPGYALRWTAADDLVTPSTGSEFLVDTNKLPVGNTMISVHIVRLGQNDAGKEA